MPLMTNTAFGALIDGSVMTWTTNEMIGVGTRARQEGPLVRLEFFPGSVNNKPNDGRTINYETK